MQYGRILICFVREIKKHACVTFNKKNKPIFSCNKKVGESVRFSSGFPLFEKPICINVTLTTILSAESLSSFARISIKFLHEKEVYLSVITPI